MGCAVGRHLKEVLIESGTNDRCPFVFSYMFLIPRLFPSGLLTEKKKKKVKWNILKYTFLVQAKQNYLFSLVNSDLLYFEVHKEFSLYHRTTKDNFQCISLLANIACRQVITCPVSFGPKVKIVTHCLQNKSNRLTIWISNWLICTRATLQTYWAATFQRSTSVRLSAPIPVRYNTISLR